VPATLMQFSHSDMAFYPSSAGCNINQPAAQAA
jgi:hypothetical protein